MRIDDSLIPYLWDCACRESAAYEGLGGFRMLTVPAQGWRRLMLNRLLRWLLVDA